MSKLKIVWFIKDGFKKGEYSFYEGIPEQSEKYLFGVSKRYEAEIIRDYLNSGLIAAAPELLKALKSGLKRLVELQNATGYPTVAVQIQFEEAIAKATGEE